MELSELWWSRRSSHIVTSASVRWAKRNRDLNELQVVLTDRLHVSICDIILEPYALILSVQELSKKLLVFPSHADGLSMNKFLRS